MQQFYGGDFKDEAFYESLKACGEETRIYRTARLGGVDRISIGRGCRIDDFTLIAGGRGVDIGDRIHISSYSSIIGGGECVMESYSGLSHGCRIITGSEAFMGEGMTNPCIPDEFRTVKIANVIIRKHALLFTNVIVLPGVEIAEGCVIGAGAIISKDTEPWGVYINKDGRQRRVKDRPKEKILQFEQECIEKYGY